MGLGKQSAQQSAEGAERQNGPYRAGADDGGGYLPRPGADLKAPEAPSHTTDLTVRYAMLDFNDHLTNPLFPELMLEPLGPTWLNGHHPVRMDINYQAEARYADAIRAEVALDGTTTHHALRRGGNVLGLMRVTWTAKG